MMKVTVGLVAAGLEPARPRDATGAFAHMMAM